MASEKKTKPDTPKRPRTRAGSSTLGETRTRKKGHKFTIAAPVAHGVSIAGSFNNWTPQTMKRSTKGVWSISLPLQSGTYEYKFVIDSEWMEDPASPERVSSPFGGFNSVYVVP